MAKTLGPTGRYPEGKLTEQDDGEIQMGVTVRDGKIIIAFGDPVSWIAFGPKEARELAGHLVERARMLEAGQN